MFNFEFIDGGKLQVHKLLVKEEETILGFYLLVPHGIDILEVHTEFFPEAFGRTDIISREAMHLVFSVDDNINMLVTKVPVNNKLAKRLTLKMGFKQYGILPESYKTNNTWIDQEVFYIFRKDVLCQQQL